MLSPGHALSHRGFNADCLNRWAIADFCQCDTTLTFKQKMKVTTLFTPVEGHALSHRGFNDCLNRWAIVDSVCQWRQLWLSSTKVSAVIYPCRGTRTEPSWIQWLLEPMSHRVGPVLSMETTRAQKWRPIHLISFRLSLDHFSASFVRVPTWLSSALLPRQHGQSCT